MPEPQKPLAVTQATREGLFDTRTGDHVGVIDLHGREQYMLTRAQYEHLAAPGDLSGVVYDTASRAVRFTVDGVQYDIDWTAGRITSSDGLSKTFVIDPNGRFSSATLQQ